MECLNIRRSATLLFLGFLFAYLASGCSLLGDSEGEGDSTNDSGVTVLQAALGNGINEDQQLTGLVARAFPVDTSRVYAVLVLQGIEVGAEVTARWYQLSVQNAPPEGSFVSEAGVALVENNITEDGAARVALDLGSNDGALPAGDWVVRIYVDGEFIRTMGFVITPQISGEGQGPGQAAPTTTPEGLPQPTEAAPSLEPTAPPAPQTYTVQPGDTLTTIAEQFRPVEEPVDAYVVRLMQANQLEPGATLFVDQVLTLPGPPAP